MRRTLLFLLLFAAGSVLAQEPEPVTVDVLVGGGRAARVDTTEAKHWTPPFNRPRVQDNMVLYGVHAYKVLSSYGYGGTGPPVHSRRGDSPSCDSGDWQSLPEGWQIAPDTEEVRSNVVAPFTWSTHLMIVYNETGLDSHFPAYRTAGLPPAGVRFGDSQAKLQWKRLEGGTVQYRCTWKCYQILIRRPIRGRHENDSLEPPNRWTFSDAVS